jgi:hypothetical protein
MSIALNSLYDISCKHPDDYKKAMEWINRLCEKIKRRREINGKYKTSSAVISNPEQAKAKGAPRKKKSSKKKSQCSHCNDPILRKRNCPLLVQCDKQHEDDEEACSHHVLCVFICKCLCSILNIIIICFHRGVDKNCGSKCKRKVVDVTHSKQENINKRTSK